MVRLASRVLGLLVQKLIAGKAVVAIVGAVLWPAVAMAECGPPRSIRFIESMRISDPSKGLREPSGLTLGKENRHLFTVSDNIPRVFRLGLDGDLKPKHTMKTRSEDLEGITFDVQNDRFIVASEAETALTTIDLTNQQPKHFPLSQMAGFDIIAEAFQNEPRKNGLEGITIVPDSGQIFLLKEQDPRLLIQISPDLSEIQSALELTAAMGFVDDNKSDLEIDVSGIAYDTTVDCFWIVSDRAQRLYLFDLESQTATSYNLTWLDKGNSRTVADAEGVAFNAASGRLYIVNDKGKQSRLFIYQVE